MGNTWRANAARRCRSSVWPIWCPSCVRIPPRAKRSCCEPSASGCADRSLAAGPMQLPDSRPLNRVHASQEGIMDSSHRVVIVGGGFGGLYAAQALAKASVQVTLIDRRNFHLFQPLLYQVATGGLSPANIASPLRAVLKRQRNTRVLLGEVIDFDLEHRQVILKDGTEPYDSLIVATGSSHHYFGHPEWEKYAPGLKSIEDATNIRRRFLSAFEEAERCTDAEERQALLTFVVVGGGPTGVELAGTLGEVAHSTLRGNFRAINPAQARILLLEGLGRILSHYPPKLSAKAVKSLNRLGVTVHTGTVVTDVQP